MIEVPQEFKPTINTVYPPSNFCEFERWFGENYKENLDREYLGIYWCGYQVNHNYGQDVEAMNRLQSFVDNLPRDKRYFSVFQYDNGCGVDFKDLDIVTFGMSYRLPEQKPTYVIPLIGQMAERQWICEYEKRYIANFVGSITHPIRKKVVDAVGGIDNYYVSTQQHTHYAYNDVMASSTWTISPVGYGKTSFRHYESIHQESIPVVIYEDEVMEPYGIDINEYGVKIHESEIDLIPQILSSFSPYAIEQKRKRMKELYPILCTYEGVFDKIIETLQSES